MTKEETAKLLTYCSAMDNRKVTEETVEAWHATIGDLDYQDCMVAAKAHFRHEDSYLNARAILRGVYRERSRRLDGFLDPLPKADPSDTEAYKKELRANRIAKASGQDVPSGLELTGPPSPEVAETLAALKVELAGKSEQDPTLEGDNA